MPSPWCPFSRAGITLMTDKPNILLIVVDTLRADALGCYRSGDKTTPNLDRLAREGVRFSNFFSQSSWTLPAFATIFSGLYPWEHGYFRTYDYYHGDNFLSSVRRLGYRVSCCVSFAFFQVNFRLARVTDGSVKKNDLPDATAHVEKLVGDDSSGSPRLIFWHLGNCHLPYFTREKINPAGRLSPLFQENLFGGFGPAPRVPFALLPLFSRLVNRPLPGKLYRKLKNSESVKKPFLRLLDRWGGKRKRTIKSLKDEINSGRMVLTPSEIRSLREAYAYSVGIMDEYLGRVFNRIRTSAGREWIVIVTSDHGEELLEKGTMGHNTSLYDTILRIPLIVWSGGRRAAGRVESGYFSHVNLAPTIMELAAGGHRRSGSGLAGLLKGESRPASAPIVSADLRSIAVIRPPFKLIMTADGEIDYSDLASARFNRTELYDIENDTGEKYDLSRLRPDLVADLRRELRERVVGRKAGPGEKMPDDEREKMKDELTALGYL